MSRDETQVATILRELQERAKELNCLYRVDELLNRPELPMDLIFRSIVEILPHGWQFPHECQARILFENEVIESANFRPTSWTQSANLSFRAYRWAPSKCRTASRCRAPTKGRF